MHALVAEAMKKAAIIWVTAGEPGAYPLWCMPVEGGLAVIVGGDEQPAPGLAEAATATVSARGDHGGRIVTWTARVEPVSPGGEDWDALAVPLAGKRLNSSGTAEALAAVWADGSTLLRLVPDGEDVHELPDASGAEPPRPTPAANRTAKPFRLHKVRRR